MKTQVEVSPIKYPDHIKKYYENILTEAQLQEFLIKTSMVSKNKIRL